MLALYVGVPLFSSEAPHFWGALTYLPTSQKKCDLKKQKRLHTIYDGQLVVIPRPIITVILKHKGMISTRYLGTAVVVVVVVVTYSSSAEESCQSAQTSFGQKVPDTRTTTTTVVPLHYHSVSSNKCKNHLFAQFITSQSA